MFFLHRNIHFDMYVKTLEFTVTFSLLFAAAGLSALWLIIHLVLGGREIAAPMLASESLPAVVRDTQYLCWHFTSVAIGAMTVLFATAAITEDLAYAIAATGLAFGFFVVGVGLVIKIGAAHRRVPQGWLFLPVAALGLLGLMA